MANESVNVTTCVYSENVLAAESPLFLFAYFVMTPVYFLFGFSIHSICLLALYDQSKKEAQFNYQIFLVGVESLEIIAFTMYSLSYHWCTSVYFPWCSSNFVVMWYGIRLSFPLSDCFMAIRLLLAVSMAADRVYALARPFKYKTIRRKWHQSAALAISCLVGIFANFPSIFILDTLWNETTKIYERDFQFEFVSSVTGRFFFVLRGVLLVGGLTILIVCNTTIIVLYRNKKQKSNISKNNKQQEKDKATEQTIFRLTVSQSIFTTIDIVLCTLFYGGDYFAEDFMYCFNEIILIPILDTSLQITGTTSLYVLLLINASLRKMVRDTCRSIFFNKVAPVQNTQTSILSNTGNKAVVATKHA